MVETARTDSNPPIQSIAPASTARDGGTSTTAPAMAASAIGTLIRNVELHVKLSRSHPASNGPAAMARPDVAAHTVTAVARSRLGNVATSRDNVAGMTIAAATPMTIRARITPSVASVSAPATDPATKMISPMISAPRRLYRSPITPHNSINDAYGTVYPSITH